MGKHLKLTAEIALPLPEAVTQTYGFLGRKGSGKTYGASKLAEELLAAHAQVIAIDPVGNWWGLRVGAASASFNATGFQIPVIGGLHGDLPITPESGARVADLLCESGLSAVIDVSQLRKGQRRQFVTDFAEQLFARRKAQPQACHLFVEEAQLFVPQRCGADEARMLGAFEDLVRLGRNFGIGVSLISQRPQSVNKEALSQVECLLAFQIAEAHARKALIEWVHEQGIDVAGMLAELPKLQPGNAMLWSPQWLRRLERVSILEKRTLDASATPTLGKSRKAATLADVDVAQLKEAFAEQLAQAEASDPKKLRARIAELEKELAAKPRQVTERVEVSLLSDEDRLSLIQLASRVAERHAETQALGDLLEKIYSRAQQAAQVQAREAERPRHNNDIPGRAESNHQKPALKPAAAAPGEVTLKLGARLMLEILRREGPLPRKALATFAGISPGSGTCSDYVGALLRSGLVVEESGELRALGEEGGAPVSFAEVETRWCEKKGALKAGARKMLGELRVRRSLSRKELGEAVGISPSSGTMSDYVSRLRRSGLVETGDGSVSLSECMWRLANREGA